MAFGFPAYHTEEIDDSDRNGISRRMVKNALEKLGWLIVSERERSLTASTKINIWSWGERVVIQFHSHGGLTITSRCLLPTQCIDWGKNKTNVQKLIRAIHDDY